MVDPAEALTKWGKIARMHYVYILKSSKDASKYIGITEDLRNRLREHNNGGTKSNQHKVPYKIAWYCAFADKYKAYAFEKYLKSSSGYAFAAKHLLTLNSPTKSRR